MSVDLTTKAMITSLSIKGIWSAVAEDERITAEVASQHGVSAEVGRYLKKICDPKKIPTLKKFNQSRTTLYNIHRASTLAWDDKGGRLLPSEQYFDYMTKIGTAKQALVDAYEAFLAELPALRTAAQNDPNVNGLYRDEDWPDVNELRAKVDIRVRIIPLADSSHFLCKLGDEEEAKIKKQVEQDIFGKLAGGLADLIGQLKTVITNSRASIEGYTLDDKGKTVKTFHDTAITNVRKMVEQSRKLNIIGDPTLTALLDEIEISLCRKDPQTLRDNYMERAKAVSDANVIAKKLAEIESALCSEAEAA